MDRAAPCCAKKGLKKGPWSHEEDQILLNYIQRNGHASWRALPELAGLLRCGKSCRLRWTNYLRPDIKRGSFTEQEERTIIQLHAILGNRWSSIASQLPGRTDNEIKNFWKTRLQKRLLKMGLDPSTHVPIAEAKPSAPEGYKALAVTRHKAQWESARLEAEARHSSESLIMSSTSTAGYHTVPSDNPPADYFLKIWNSEAGKAFRKENHHPNGGGDDPFLSSEIPLSSVSSLCCVKTPEVISCQPDITMGQTEDKATEELGFPEPLLDFLDTDDNNNNTNGIQSELRTDFLHQPASPWPELLDEDYWINIAFSQN